MNNLTVTFFSNFLLHHQTPFCESMVKKLGDGFRFVATETIPQERINMGYRNLENAPYAINSYMNEESYNEAMRLGYESDVVIIGSAGDEFIEKRLLENKLTFRYNERFFKKFLSRFDPRVWIYRYKSDFVHRNKNLHMLCASAYTAPDCRSVFSYPNKIYKWGYFPETDVCDDVDEILSKKKNHSILWAGRLIEYKHPEAVIYLSRKLRKNNIPFDVNIIGIGSMSDKIQKMISDYELDDCVHMLGSMSPEKVREYMQQAEIFLFTSDRSEGWGAVLNESMSCACAVVACQKIGSVPYLIEDGKNGYVYNNKKEIYQYVKNLLDDKELRENMQRNAYDTIKNVWNAESAVDRFLHLIECIQQGKETGYIYGPCSRD